MASGKGVRDMIHHARRTGRSGKRGPWRVEVDGHAGISYGYLIHYGTRMLKWRWEPLEILESWTGYGSVSDQTGVNAALDALGSRLHYSRDARGGGPRINPFRVGSMVGGMLRSASPAVYNPGMVFPPRLSYNARRRKRR